MKKKNRIVMFALTFLIIALLQVLVSPTYSICAEQKRKTSEAYPTTPEGVVEAFCNEDFIGTGAGIGDWAKIQQYTIWSDAPGWDESILVVTFNVTKIRENSNTAEVKVEYKIIGRLYSDEIGPIFEKAKTDEVIIYKLLKKGSQWKIKSPQLHPHVGVKTKIKLLKEVIMPQVKDPRKIKRLKQVLLDIEDELAKNKSN